MNDELITAEELGKRLRIRPATIRLWTRDGIVPAIRITGKVIRYDAVEVVAALRLRANQAIDARAHQDATR